MILKQLRVYGSDEHDGDLEITTVVLDRVAYGGKNHFTVYHYVDGYDGERTDVYGFDSLSLAEKSFQSRVESIRGRYDERLHTQRCFRARDLKDLADGWAEGPDRDLVYRVAQAIEMGHSAEEFAR